MILNQINPYVRQLSSFLWLFAVLSALTLVSALMVIHTRAHASKLQKHPLSVQIQVRVQDEETKSSLKFPLRFPLVLDAK